MLEGKEAHFLKKWARLLGSVTPFLPLTPPPLREAPLPFCPGRKGKGVGFSTLLVSGGLWRGAVYSYPSQNPTDVKLDVQRKAYLVGYRASTTGIWGPRAPDVTGIKQGLPAASALRVATPASG
jgi:hypothetical protein